jgi:hypothetical protein
LASSMLSRSDESFRNIIAARPNSGQGTFLNRDPNWLPIRLTFLGHEKFRRFCRLRHQAALASRATERQQKIRDEDLTRNASQGSINQQIFPLVPERFLSELPEPPLGRVFSKVEMSCWRKRALGYLQANLTIVSLNIGDLPVICMP